MLTLDKIYHAAFVLKNVVRRTDLIHASNIKPGGNIYLKTENLQVTGSFKVRGACYKISQLSEDEKQRGVVACSAGNHAQGVALAAATENIKSLICIPDIAPISKVEATRNYGAEVELVDGIYDDAFKRACEIKESQNMTFIHPFDDVDVIAGQGTIGLEILEQLQDVDSVVVPIGGGGLISGVACAIKMLKPSCKVYGVQSEGAPSMFNSFRDKENKELESVSTFADGIAVKKPGSLTYDMCCKYVDEIVTVTDDEIAAAILMLMEKQKLVAEGAGAVAVAAAMFDKVDTKDKNVVCLVSGGNIDVNILSRVITRGLVTGGRISDLTLELIDKPGQLEGVAKTISSKGGNVIAVHHDKAQPNMAINACLLGITMETRNFEHIIEIKESLKKKGFRLAGDRRIDLI